MSFPSIQTKANRRMLLCFLNCHVLINDFRFLGMTAQIVGTEYPSMCCKGVAEILMCTSEVVKVY